MSWTHLGWENIVYLKVFLHNFYLFLVFILLSLNMNLLARSIFICQSCSKRHCNEVSYHLPSKKSFSIKVHVKFSSLKTQVKSNKTNKIYAQEISVSTFEMPWVWSFSRGNSLGSTRFLHGKYCRVKWMALKSLR